MKRKKSLTQTQYAECYAKVLNYVAQILVAAFFIDSFSRSKLEYCTSKSTNIFYGGESGIRTHDTVSRIHTFQACAFNHSAISPSKFLYLFLVLQ